MLAILSNAGIGSCRAGPAPLAPHPRQSWLASPVPGRRHAIRTAHGDMVCEGGITSCIARRSRASLSGSAAAAPSKEKSLGLRDKLQASICASEPPAVARGAWGCAFWDRGRGTSQEKVEAVEIAFTGPAVHHPRLHWQWREQEGRRCPESQPSPEENASCSRQQSCLRCHVQMILRLVAPLCRSEKHWCRCAREGLHPNLRGTIFA